MGKCIIKGPISQSLQKHRIINLILPLYTHKASIVMSEWSHGMSEEMDQKCGSSLISPAPVIVVQWHFSITSTDYSSYTLKMFVLKSQCQTHSHVQYRSVLSVATWPQRRVNLNSAHPWSDLRIAFLFFYEFITLNIVSNEWYLTAGIQSVMKNVDIGQFVKHPDYVQ